MSELELWGGHECTLNRVGDLFRDQTRRSGHHERPGDLDLFADLGVKALRYPVLWERTAPDSPDALDFRWSDERLARMAGLGLRPIVGLLHHGGGPRYTDLLQPDFAERFARYAGAVARRYRDVIDWTPINEPLTTARFSCLYGHWYPHARDETLLWTALLNQVDAIRLAMGEIRQVQGAARLIQTEDLGRSYASARLGAQADFENERRWLTWDLLCGRVVPGHALHARLAGCGLGDRLDAIAASPCPPDVIGVNHYLTSERFLDHRLDRYPTDRHGGNGEIAYADVEAIRVLLPAPGGLAGVLQEAWARYGTTLAVTESHNGCTREDQLRWLHEGWRTAQALRSTGVDIAAVTAWALLGAYDWDSLLTQDRGRYESGAFDVRGQQPRPTAVAALLKSLGDPAAELHPVADGDGWWRRDIRLCHPPALNAAQPARSAIALPARPSRRPLLITGATGTLGQALARACAWRGIDYVLTDRHRLDLQDEGSIGRALDALRPWAVVNAAGWVKVDEAETHEAACLDANAAGSLRLAEACGRRDMGFVGFSSDLVFAGSAGRALVESDDCAPLNVYGRSKAAADRSIMALGGRALIVRTAAFFSPHDPYNFAAQVHRILGAGDVFTAADDLVVSPTYVPDLVAAVLDLAIDGETGLWHLANQGAVSWAEFARMVSKAVGFNGDGVEDAPWRTLNFQAERPAFVPLASERGMLLPGLDEAVARYAAAAPGGLIKRRPSPS